MPKRSNLFQRLALVVHEALEPGWAVNESEMLRDSVTQQLREVDIVATQLVAGHLFVLSVECRDHNRPADVHWVEGACKKHEHLPTSKLVLWSRSGFTNQAKIKAAALKIDTVSQAQATYPIWAHFARSLVGAYVQHVSPAYAPFVDVVLPDGTLKRHEDVADWSFFDGVGKLVGSMPALLHQLNFGQLTRETLLDHAPMGRGTFHVLLVPPEAWFVDLPVGIRCRTHRIGVGIETTGTKAGVTSASAVVANKVTTLAIAELDQGTLEVVVEEAEDGTNSSRSRLVRKEA